MKKRFITGFACGALIFGTVGVFAGQYVAVENPFSVQLNGENVNIEGYNINDNTYFKLRDVADVVGGFEVDFQNNTIQLSKDGYVYENVTVNDESDVSLTNNFSRVGSIGENVYVTPLAGTNGGFVFSPGNVDINQLPYGMMNLGDIYSFCYYNERIYYLTGEEGSDILPASIYSCDINGSDNKLIVDDAANNTEIYIVNNYMYYNQVKELPDYYTNAGINRVNLENNVSEKFVNNDSAYMYFCDENNLYYSDSSSVGTYYSIDYNGQNINKLADNADETPGDYSISKFIKDDMIYYISGNKLYSQRRNDAASLKEMCEVPQEGYNKSSIMNVDDKYVYYAYYDAYSSSGPKAQVFTAER